MLESFIPKSPPTAEEAFARYVLARDLVHRDPYPSPNPQGWGSPPSEGVAAGECYNGDAGTD